MLLDRAFNILVIVSLLITFIAAGLSIKKVSSVAANIRVQAVEVTIKLLEGWNPALMHADEAYLETSCETNQDRAYVSDSASKFLSIRFLKSIPRNWVIGITVEANTLILNLEPMEGGCQDSTIPIQIVVPDGTSLNIENLSLRGRSRLVLKGLPEGISLRPAIVSAISFRQRSENNHAPHPLLSSISSIRNATITLPLYAAYNFSFSDGEDLRIGVSSAAIRKLDIRNGTLELAVIAEVNSLEQRAILPSGSRSISLMPSLFDYWGSFSPVRAAIAVLLFLVSVFGLLELRAMRRNMSD